MSVPSDICNPSSEISRRSDEFLKHCCTDNDTILCQQQPADLPLAQYGALVATVMHMDIGAWITGWDVTTVMAVKCHHSSVQATGLDA